MATRPAIEAKEKVDQLLVRGGGARRIGCRLFVPPRLAALPEAAIFD